MIYITKYRELKPVQISWEDVLFDRVPANEFPGNSDKGATITLKREFIPDEIREKIHVDQMILALSKFNTIYQDLINKDLTDMYTHFKLPKAAGGWRKIDAPMEPLKTAQSVLAGILKNTCGGMHHTSAFAYIENRSILDAVQKHQRAESNWFLHTDFSGFFPNTTKEFVLKMFRQIFPFSEIMKDPRGKQEMSNALSVAFYNGGLVQGSPLSPCLTNMMFIPIDYELNTFFTQHKLTYTRYADDIYISGQECFPWRKMVNEIKSVLSQFDAVYQIKPEKTHFGNRKGRNWMLGLMLNGDNNITVGYRRKNQFKGELTNFILDTKNGKPWPPEDVRHLAGELSYFKMIEKQYFEDLIRRTDCKWKVNTMEMIKNNLSGNILFCA